MNELISVTRLQRAYDADASHEGLPLWADLPEEVQDDILNDVEADAQDALLAAMDRVREMVTGADEDGEEW